MPVNTNSKTVYEQGAGSVYALDPLTGEPTSPHAQTRWHHLGEQAIAVPVNRALALPDGTTIVTLSARTNPAYYTVNGATANSNSGGFVATNTVQTVGPLDNLASLRVSSDGTVHAIFWREAD